MCGSLRPGPRSSLGHPRARAGKPCSGRPRIRVAIPLNRAVPGAPAPSVYLCLTGRGASSEPEGESMTSSDRARSGPSATSAWTCPRTGAGARGTSGRPTAGSASAAPSPASPAGAASWSWPTPSRATGSSTCKEAGHRRGRSHARAETSRAARSSGSTPGASDPRLAAASSPPLCVLGKGTHFPPGVAPVRSVARPHGSAARHGRLGASVATSGQGARS